MRDTPRPPRKGHDCDVEAPESTGDGQGDPVRAAAVHARDDEHPASRSPGGTALARRRVPDHPRRADAGRERAPERRNVRHDLDGARGRAAHGGVLRQEHDRQGRVPADRGARDAMRQHPEPAVARTGRRRGDGMLDDGIERGGDARRACAQAPMAARPQGGGQACGQAEPRDGHQRPGVLGEVRELLGRRDAPRADGGRPVPPVGGGGGRAVRREHDRCRGHPGLDVRRLLRAREGDLRCAGRLPGRHGDRRAGPRRRRVRGVRRIVRRSGARVGLPPPPRRLDQRVGAQVRARLPRRRLDRLARCEVAARGSDLLGQLPRRQHADLRPQLLAAGRPDRGPVLQLPPPGIRRVQAGSRLRA